MAKTEDVTKATEELETATAEVVVAEAPADDIIKGLAASIDRLTKGGLGSWDAAHNGNELDKSSPEGDGAPDGGFKSIQDEEVRPGAEARVNASRDRAKGGSRGKSNNEITNNALAKGDTDEEETEVAETRKSRDTVTQDRFVNALTTDEGSEEFVPVAEASEAITFLTETMAKAFGHLSAQIAALSEEVHDRIDDIEKSQAASNEATIALLKAAKADAERIETVAKSFTKATAPTAPATGIVVVNTADAGAASTAPTKSLLAKSLANAMNQGKLSVSIGAPLLARIDSQGPARVFETMSAEVKAIVLDASTEKK